MDISAGIAAASNGLTIVKVLKSIEASYDQARLKAQIAEIYEALSEARHALVDAKEALAERDREISRLKATAAERANLIAGDGGYSYRVTDDGSPIGFPFCPKCDPTDGRLVQLVQDGTVDTAKCPICGTQYRPVTCYTGNGNTLVTERNARRAANTSRQYEIMEGFDRLSRTY